MNLTFQRLEGRYVVCRLEPDADWPDWLPSEGLLNLTRTDHELSIVCREEAVPASVDPRRSGWVCLEIVGPLAFELTGILAEVSSRLAEAEISLFAFSTYNTDYVLVHSDAAERACEALAAAGHRIQSAPGSRPGRAGDPKWQDT